jgi:selenocysteine-specific elongation factor
MIVATAGHVDHGKTALVKALTGVDTDRLPEEKKRGMTIDLGFAYLPLAPGATIGFVDVPGHERFIHNMLAGVSGIDFALLVVAADDGPMPQTFEHVAILDLLGIAQGAVALTKTDRVTPERIAEVAIEVETLLAGSPLSGAPLFPLSPITGSGIEALKERLTDVALHLRARGSDDNFRLSIDRSFTVAGAGLVVTGTALSGEVCPGDQVRSALTGMTARVRSIHAHNAPAQRGRAGQRCALNLAGIEGKSAMGRGDWIVKGNVPEPVRRLDARLKVLGALLEHWTSIHVHIGAADVTGRVATLGAPAIGAGSSGLVQLVLDRPVAAVRGDRFIVRDQSATRTIGGGAVIDVYPPRRARARPERLAYLASMESDDHALALADLARQAKGGLDIACFAANRNLPNETVERLVSRTGLRRAGERVFSAGNWRELRTKALATLGAWHQRSPDVMAVPTGKLMEGSGVRVPLEVVLEIADELVREGALVRDGAGVRLPRHRTEISAADQALWQKMRPLFEKNELRPPSVAELATASGEDARRLELACSRLERHGLLVRISKTRFFLSGAVAKLREMAVQEAGANGAITAAAFRDRTGIGRNVAIEVLEYLDRIKFTRRVGDRHLVLAAAHGRDSHPGGAPGLQIQ